MQCVKGEKEKRKKKRASFVGDSNTIHALFTQTARTDKHTRAIECVCACTQQSNMEIPFSRCCVHPRFVSLIYSLECVVQRLDPPHIRFTRQETNEKRRRFKGKLEMTRRW